MANNLGLCKLCYVYSRSIMPEDGDKICEECEKKIKNAEKNSPQHG